MDRQVTLVVTALLRNQHLSRHPFDEEIAARCLTVFLKTLDPWKLYFNQSDVDQFKADQARVISQIRRGDISEAYTIFKVFLQRLEERVKMADEALAMEHDFTVDEEMISDPDAAQYAKSEAEARDMWRKRVKYDLLVLKSGKSPEKDPKDRLSRRYHSFVKRMQQTDDVELREMYLTALTSAYDPHSSYMAPQSSENFDIQMKLQLDGIGAQLQFDDGYTTVADVVPGGAADKDGRLKKKDRITGVGQGTDGKIVDVVDMKLSDVVQLVRGKRGTIVRLEVIPVGSTEKKIYDITRAKIELTDSAARGKVVEEIRDGTTYRVGVIDLPSFYMDMDGARRNLPDYRSTTRDVAKILKEFKDQRVDAVVLDLRRNGGGSLPESINLTGLFIDKGPVVQVKDKNSQTHPYNDEDSGALWDGPLVVLISKFSASASEIFAGAIQDYGRGLIVGDKTTHGKGTVQSLLAIGQQLFPIPNPPEMGDLKITMQQFYRPNGDSTQREGVRADVELPSLTTHLDVGEGDLDYAMPFDRIAAADHDNLHQVDAPVVERLRSLSNERVKNSTDFQKVFKNITRYQEQKSRKTVSLNEQKFKEARGDSEEEESEEKLEEELKAAKEVFTRNFYNNEALQVVIDYVQSNKLARAN